MPESTITFRVDAALKRRFATRAQELDRDGSQVLRDFMRSFVGEEQTYEDWFRSRVQEARSDTRPPVSSKTVERHFAGRRAAARRKTRSR